MNNEICIIEKTRLDTFLSSKDFKDIDSIYISPYRACDIFHIAKKIYSLEPFKLPWYRRVFLNYKEYLINIYARNILIVIEASDNEDNLLEIIDFKKFISRWSKLFSCRMNNNIQGEIKIILAI